MLPERLLQTVALNSNDPSTQAGLHHHGDIVYLTCKGSIDSIRAEPVAKGGIAASFDVIL